VAQRGHARPLIVDSQWFFGWPRKARAMKLGGMFGSGAGVVNQIGCLRLTASQHLSRLLAATIFPPRCCLCGSAAESWQLDLCDVCRADLPWLEEPSAGVFVAMRFALPADDMIRALKYRNVIAHGRVLGVLLAQAVRQNAVPLPRLLVPVPLHGSRLRERGFNQAAALARYAGRTLRIPHASHLLRRVRDTPSQTALSVAERHRNVRGAFAVNGARAQRRLLAAGHVAIVDDVVTTGSTVAELKSVLHAAGMTRVDVWAVARADGPGRPDSATRPARVESTAQASPNFLSTAAGGPANFSIGTLPT
jgi:ComF family protein